MLPAKRNEKLKADHPEGTNVWFKLHSNDEYEVQGVVIEVSGPLITLRLGTGQVIRINAMVKPISNK